MATIYHQAVRAASITKHALDMLQRMRSTEKCSPEFEEYAAGIWKACRALEDHINDQIDEMLAFAQKAKAAKRQASLKCTKKMLNVIKAAQQEGGLSEGNILRTPGAGRRTLNDIKELGLVDFDKHCLTEKGKEAMAGVPC